MNREEAKRCTVKIRAAFVSIKEQMRHKGEVPIGRANSIGSRSEPILPPRTRKKKRIEDTCLWSPISKLPQKSPPTRYKFIAFLRNISLPEFHSSFPLPWYKNTYIYISFVTLRGEGISFYTAIFSSSFSKVGLIFQSWILLPPLFFLASSIPPFNSKPPRNLLFIHTPSEKLFIAFTSRNLPLSLSLFTHPRKTSSKFYPLDANARTPFPRYSASPLLPLTRNHDKTRISIFRVIAPLAFRRNRRFPFNRSPFDNGEIFPRERPEGETRERSRFLSTRGRRGALLSFTRESSSREGVKGGG